MKLDRNNRPYVPTPLTLIMKNSMYMEGTTTVEARILTIRGTVIDAKIGKEGGKI
jgi:hypothetical protein